MYLIFDTETTGLPRNIHAPFSDLNNWPRIVQLSWQLHNNSGELIEYKDCIIYPKNFDIPYNATKIHGISTEQAKHDGLDLVEVLKEFNNVLMKSTVLVGYNLLFDVKIINSEFFRNKIKSNFLNKKNIDIQIIATKICKIPGNYIGSFKYPKLSELYNFLFGSDFKEAHNASADVSATAQCFFELLKQEKISFQEALMDKDHKILFLNQYNSIIKKFQIPIRNRIQNFNSNKNNNLKENLNKKLLLNSKYYFHFHNHTIYSILQSTIKIPDLVNFTYKEKFPAVGICDYGNLMGAFQLLYEVKKINKKIEKKNKNNEIVGNILNNQPLITPIIGCEIYISNNYLNKKFTKSEPDKRYTQVLLAKNKIGYQNLSKISTIGFTKGMYMGFPRVGKEIIEKYKNNIIATTGGLDSIIVSSILNDGIYSAEKEFLWWKNTFNSDFYIQLQNHELDENIHINKILLKFSKKYNVEILNQNSTNYFDKTEYNTHDIMLCIKSNALKTTKIGKGFKHRLGMPNSNFYLQTRNQIAKTFYEYPKGIYNYRDFLSKFSLYDLEENILLPKFEIPKNFIKLIDQKDSENSYLRYLTYEGVKKKYKEISSKIKERIEFELETIKNTGYPGYFLIVQDFTNQAKKMGVLVGPGRGSSAGSVVAYCIGITNIDPIKYNLLFERFLNPNRISLPDIDIDFDDHGRDKIIEYVIKKYGKNQVAQIITYGKLGGRSALRDTARVLNLSLSEAGKLAKALPNNLSLNQIKLLKNNELSKIVKSDELNGVLMLKDYMNKEDLKGQVIREALKLEGCIRNTGVHACGVIITDEDIRNLIPLTIAKDSEFLVSQFDNSVVESVGLLKMDFLGLKNLTIIKDSIELIRKKYKIIINIDLIPLTDKKTFELFQKGETIGVFQFESIGMQKYLKKLKPDKFDDLIAMNALYRPGPMKYIPNFIKRKHGHESITYDLLEMKEYLESTYGITVYQEQVMLLSQKLANFSKGDADILRKAMGKKQRAILDKMKGLFIKNGFKNGYSSKILNKIWGDWESFAEYAFNKSHSTCYSLVAFQTAYLKANFPAEYMAALLSNNLNQINTTALFMEECKKMGIKVLGPNLNESEYRFVTDNNNNIRFGLGAIKGIGEVVIQSIINEREKNGKFKNLFNFLERIDSLNMNKKILDNLILSGALDELDKFHRSQYFQKNNFGITIVEELLRYSIQYKKSNIYSNNSLFQNYKEAFEIKKPIILNCNKWTEFEKLQHEKETIGIYISSHPMNQFQHEIEFLNPIKLIELENDKTKYLNKNITIVGMITKIEEWISKNNKIQLGLISLEDTTTTITLKLFANEYLKYKHSFFYQNQFLTLDLEFKQTKNKQSIYPKINSIFFLNKILNQKIKKITFYFKKEQLKIKDINEINDYIINNPGKQLINVLIENQDNIRKIYLSKYTYISKTLLDLIKIKKWNFKLS